MSKFPMEIEKLAAWRGKIYESRSRGNIYYKLVYYAGDGRKTLGFPSAKEALAGADELVKTLGKANGDSIVISGTAALHYRQAMESMKELPKPEPLNVVVAEYVRLKKIVGDAPLPYVGQFYAKRHGINLPRRTITEAVDEMLKAKRAEKLSERHIADLESRLTRFGNEFTLIQLSSLTGPQIAAWLRGLNLSPRSQNNYRMAIQTLVSFSKERGWLPKDWDEFDTVKKLKEKNGVPEIFTPAEIKALLGKANDKLKAYVAIAAFAGVRQAELERLDWSKVDLDEEHITIDASIAKTASRRVIPMSANLKLWLKKLARKQGPVCGYQNVTNELLKLAKDAKVEWKTNGLRHSFGSYRTAQTSDIPKVSYEMGNSVAMVKQHYHGLATAKAAAEWFAIVP